MIAINLTDGKIDKEVINKIGDFAKKLIGDKVKISEIFDISDVIKIIGASNDMGEDYGEEEEKSENFISDDYLDSAVILPYLTIMYSNMSTRGIKEMYYSAKFVVHNKTGLEGTALSKETSKLMIKLLEYMEKQLDKKYGEVK